MVKLTAYVYGAEGHRQRESFNKSYTIIRNGMMHLNVYNADLTGTHEYTIVEIFADTEDHAIAELYGQLSDGVFETSRTGDVKIDEIEEVTV